MRNKTTRLCRILAFLLATILIGAAVCGFLKLRKHESSTAAPEVTHVAEQAEETEQATEEPLDVLFLASDYQQENGWPEPKETLTNVIRATKRDNKIPTNAIICGDYTNDRKLHDYQLSPDEAIEEIKEVISSECPLVPEEDVIFVQGNHDRMTDDISKTGLHEYENYLVYVLNTEDAFPWKQGRNTAFSDRVISASADMEECFDELIRKGETRPVFIAGHVPLHFTARTSSRHSTGDNMYAGYIFDAVNKAAESLDIIYLFGHDHSKGWDCYAGGSCVFMAPGDTILIPDAGDNTANTDKYSTETLNFTYMNAGYTGYYMNCGPEELDAGEEGLYKAADEALTGTVCEIFPEEIIITRYSADGVHRLGAKGEGDPYKGGIDAGLIDESHYSKEVNSPAHITRKTAKNLIVTMR